MPVVSGTNFINIDSTRVAVNAPVSTDLMTDIVADLNYLNNGNFQNLLILNTPGVGNWIPPAGCNKILVKMVGGGGGGAGTNLFLGSTGGGGGGGAYQEFYYSVTPGVPVGYNVGAGGGGGVNTNGADGIDTSFGSIIAMPGQGGNISGTGGAGGAPSIGTNLWGIPGQAGQPYQQGSQNRGGYGGASVFGPQVYTADAGSQGAGGGGGAYSGPTSGGAGGAGVILIYY